MPDIKVFVSVGRTSTPAQEEFVSAIEHHMLAHGLLPQALGRNYWSSQQPLKAIDDLMGQCAGAAIVAFERLHIVAAIERRGSQAETQISSVALPTVWNQVEAAMAYSRGLPLLVLVQEELRAEGLLETGYNWYVKRLPLGARATLDREFCGIFDDWRARVEAHHASRRVSQPPDSRQTGSSPALEARTGDTVVDRRGLRIVLETRFNDDELRTLCFDLGVDYDNLEGATKAAKSLALIAYFERRHRAGELLRYVRERCPDEL